MRKLNLAAILIFVFCAGIFSQTNEILPCPKISLIGPNGFPHQGELMFYNAEVNNYSAKSDIKYIWKVSGGKILKGQDTNVIAIKLDNPVERLLVTLEIQGLPENCSKTISESAFIETPSMPILIEELSAPFSKTNNFKNSRIYEAVAEEPSAQLYVILYLKGSTTRKTAASKEREIINFLTGKNEIVRDRIVIVKAVLDTEMVQFWLVHPGVMPPVPEN